MTQQVARLFAEALQLSEEERSDLAARLIESLDPTTEDDVETSWNTEITQRLDELSTGQVQPIPWPEARRQILDDTDEPETA